MSTLRTNTLTDAAGGNSMPVADINQGRAKAWANLNGTGTIALRDSFNVASVVDNGTGDYWYNFSTARPSADYAPSAAGRNAASFVVATPQSDASSAAQARVVYGNASFAVTDVTYAFVSVLGD
jgi:hypothetical protein